MIRIALDLELEQSKTNPQTPDSLLDHQRIIQVGCVVFEDTPFTILYESCHEVNIGVPISKYIQKLTGITNEQISKGLSLKEVYLLLNNSRESYNASRIVIQWGGDDMNCLRRELPDDIDWEFGYSGKNAKHLYQDWAYINGVNQSGGLSKCVSRMGLTWLGQGKHNALVDAKNTAMIYSKLLEEMRK
jgi:inhibitor of KinA sporulation pathway (predicted exonuclease)